MTTARFVLACALGCVGLGCGGSDEPVGGADAATGDKPSQAANEPTEPAGDGDDPTGPANVPGPARTPLDPSTIPEHFETYDAAGCGTLGESCSFTDGSACEGAICNLGPGLCLPAPDATAFLTCTPGRCDADQPYCVAGQCMDLAQASCVCGKVATSDLPECGAPALAALGGMQQADGSVCLGRGARCDGPYACCDDLECRADAGGLRVCETPCADMGQTCGSSVRCCDETALRCMKFDSDADFLCYPRCSTDADCGDGCCQTLSDGTDAVCVTGRTCVASECADEGASCGESQGCCDGLACVTRGGAQTGTCFGACDGDEDCASGCCRPFTSSAGGYCVAALECTCLPQGEACGGTVTRTCCEGTTCAGSGGSSTCRGMCTSDADCGGNCCRPLSSGNGSVCDESPC